MNYRVETLDGAFTAEVIADDHIIAGTRAAQRWYPDLAVNPLIVLVVPLDERHYGELYRVAVSYTMTPVWRSREAIVADFTDKGETK